VTDSGECLLDLLRHEKDGAQTGSGEAYTPRQLRLLKRFAAWLRRVGPDRLAGMELLLGQLLGEQGEPPPGELSVRDREAPRPSGAVRRPR
jgi:hypothetical protein